MRNVKRDRYIEIKIWKLRICSFLQTYVRTTVTFPFTLFIVIIVIIAIAFLLAGFVLSRINDLILVMTKPLHTWLNDPEG